MTTRHRRVWLVVLAAALSSLAYSAAAAPHDRTLFPPIATPPPKVGRTAPTFKLTDTYGKKQTLAAFRGRRVALFFFCGCSPCGDVAREWALLQRSGALLEEETARRNNGSAPLAAHPLPKPPVTLVVYSGLNADMARTLSKNYSLDLPQTILVPDPDMRVSAQTYRADPCPRVFVLDTTGVLRYTNDHADDRPPKAPALVIVSRALSALRDATSSTKPASAGATSATTSASPSSPTR